MSQNYRIIQQGISRMTVQNGPLPKGWREVKLVDACEVIVSPVDKKTVDGELPVKLCNYTDVYYNNAIDSKINFMAATAKPREIEKFSIITDDVIITKDSETPDDIGVPAYVKETIDDLLCGYHLTILRPKKQTIGKYICYALTSQRVKYDFYRFANGITRFGLTTESYRKIKIPLPPTPEQKAIASLLEKWDTAIEKTEVLIEAKEKRFKWLLKTLISDQQDNPEWRQVKLGEICTFEYGKPLKEQDRIGNEYPVFGSNGIVGRHNEYLVAGPFIVVGRKGSAGTVSYSMSNGFPIDTTFYINLQSGEIHLRFLYYLLACVELDKISAQSGVPGLNRNDAYKISISIPSSVEQSEVTRTLDVARREIDLLNQLADQYRTQKRGLMQKLLTGKWRVKPNTKARM